MRRGPLTVAGHAACRRACYDFADDAGGTNACKGFAYLPYETSQGECWAYFGGDEIDGGGGGERRARADRRPLRVLLDVADVAARLLHDLDDRRRARHRPARVVDPRPDHLRRRHFHLLLQCLLSFVFVLGCGCGPAMWRRTRPLTDAELVELKATVATAVASQAHMYDFSMALHAAWELDCGEQRAAFDALRAEWAAQTPPRESNVRQLFHGTRMENAHGIVTGGFRLPRHSGMFGKGLYFADTPLKSLQYTGISWGWRYMLVCEVELGNSKTQRGAKDVKKEDLERGWLPSVMGQRSFQSVTAATGLGGVRVPEYVVYDAAQAVPKYLLAVSEVRPSDPRALKPDGDVKVGDLTALIEMGFPEEAAKAALRKAKGDVSRAAETLARDAEREVASTAAAAAQSTLSRELAHLPAAVRKLYTEGVVMAQPGWLRESRRRYKIDPSRACLVETGVNKGRFKAHYPLEMLCKIEADPSDPATLQLALADGLGKRKPLALSVEAYGGRSTGPQRAADQRDLMLETLLGLRARLPSSATPDAEPPSNYWADESRHLARTPPSATDRQKPLGMGRLGGVAARVAHRPPRRRRPRRLTVIRTAARAAAGEVDASAPCRR